MLYGGEDRGEGVDRFTNWCLGTSTLTPTLSRGGLIPMPKHRVNQSANS
jgi:hypothetical protein